MERKAREIKVTELTRGHVVVNHAKADADKEVSYVDWQKDTVTATYMDGTTATFFKDGNVNVREGSGDDTPAMYLEGRMPVNLRSVEDGARLVVVAYGRSHLYTELKRDGSYSSTIGVGDAGQQRMIDYLAGVLQIPAPDINRED